ncbi:MAG: hypothetical protein ACTS8W_02495, partial [Arsenophonus sp. NC-PY1-MAG3]
MNKLYSFHSSPYLHFTSLNLVPISPCHSPSFTIIGEPPQEQSFLATIFISWFPMLLLIGVWIFFMRQMQG